jgi:hypothetical protein
MIENQDNLKSMGRAYRAFGKLMKD